MKTWMVMLCSFGLVASFESSAQSADLQSFLIPADRPETVGNRHRLESHATIHVDSFAMADGKTYKETSETGSVDLIGTLTVVAVASNGGPSAVDILIDQCEMTTNGNPAAVIQRGDRLSIVKQVAVSNCIVRLNGVELDQKPAFIITSFLPLCEPDRTEHFATVAGLDVRRTVGERWTLNPAVFVQYMKAYSPGAKEGDYSGTGEFTGITRTNDEEWADVRLDMTSIAPPPDKGPWKTTGFRAKRVVSLSIPLGDKPLKQGGEINQTQKIWMGNDYNNHGVLQHLLFNTVSQYHAVYTFTPLEKFERK